METPPKQTCSLCMGLLEDISKETGKYRRDFEQITENQPCTKNYICLPLQRVRQEMKALQEEEMKDVTGR
jgi:hypothetical protein